MNGKKGVWRTICGRRVFIAEGQSLTEAMKASGKFGKTDIDNVTTIKNNKTKLPTKKIVKINLDADVQKQFDNATPKERSAIAYRYIMNNLRGYYQTNDNKKVAVEQVGANKISHTLYEPKIRVSPELKKVIEAGNFIEEKEAKHKKFDSFAYYSVIFRIGKETYKAVLNIAKRKNGEYSLYDINQFERQ